MELYQGVVGLDMKIKEFLKGAAYALVTMLFMVGIIPNADFVSKIIGCVIAMLAVWRIRKKTAAGEKAGAFAAGFVSVAAVLTIIIRLISAGA